MSALSSDLRLAFRSLLNHRVASLLIIFSLALTIAANGLIFSLISAILMRPFPYLEPQQLVLVSQRERKTPDDPAPLTRRGFLEVRTSSHSFSAVEAFHRTSFNLTGNDLPEEAAGMETTAGFFKLLGTEAAAGRLFEAGDDVPGGPAVVVLDYDLWQRRFGANKALIGESILLDDNPYTVIGILPPTFDFHLRGIGVWVPLAVDPAAPGGDRREVSVMARLRPGLTAATARAELAELGRKLEAEEPEINRGYDLAARTLREQFPDRTDRQLFVMLQLAMLLVLLICCANVTNVLLARGQDRQRQLTLRVALGSGRGRLVRQLLTESAVLAALGGTLGLLLSAWGIVLLRKAIAGSVPRFVQPHLDIKVLGFTALISILAGLLFGVLPAQKSTRIDLTAVLQEGAKGSTGGRRRQWLSRGLIAGQVMVALVMLCGTGLLVRAMTGLERLESGFDASNLTTFRISLPERRYPDPASTAAFFRALDDRLAAVPGVAGATATSSLPRSGGNPTAAFSLPGETGEPQRAVTLAILSDFFSVMRIPLVAGRGFLEADRSTAAPVAIVSQSFARSYLPAGDVIGRRLVVDGVGREIVGVVGDVLQGRSLEKGQRNPLIYLPQAQTPTRSLHFLVRGSTTLAGLGDSLRSTVRGLDPGLPVARLLTMEEHIAQQLVGIRVISALISGFGLLALLLSAVGIYGLVSYSVARRAREIGIRMAMGALHGRVVKEMTLEGLLLTGIGFVLGLPGVLLITRQVSGMLGGFTQVSLLTVPAIALGLAAVAFVASYLPARRAARCDPAHALRNE